MEEAQENTKMFKTTDKKRKKTQQPTEEKRHVLKENNVSMEKTSFLCPELF